MKCGMCGNAMVAEAGARPVCDSCKEEERNLYGRVRSLLRDYEGSSLTIQDVSEMMKVDEKKIAHLVDSGYFQLVMRRLFSKDQ
jgi:hypothetical protein